MYSNVHYFRTLQRGIRQQLFLTFRYAPISWLCPWIMLTYAAFITFPTSHIGLCWLHGANLQIQDDTVISVSLSHSEKFLILHNGKKYSLIQQMYGIDTTSSYLWQTKLNFSFLKIWLFLTSLCRLNWLQNLRDPPASAFSMLGLKIHTVHPPLHGPNLL